MKLYRISQTQVEGYDTYSDAIVAAPSMSMARCIHPAGLHPSNWKLGSWCGSTAQVKVEYLGVAKSGTKLGVICASYHAG